MNTFGVVLHLPMNPFLAICLATLFVASGQSFSATLLVPPLPSDNLIKNPWFRNASNNGPGLAHWITDGHWGATDKDGNPTPDDVLGTCARISTGRGENRSGATVDPGVDTYLSQVIPADPSHPSLKFDMYWVTHTLNPGEVTIFGGESAEGPWIPVWKPFYQVFTKMVVPEGGRGQDLWTYYSDKTSAVTTNLGTGYPFFKLEVHAQLPDQYGGFKITGVYFTASPSPDALRIDHAIRTQDGTALTFARPPGQAHLVQRCDAIGTSNWSAFTNLPPVSSPENVTVLDPHSTDARQFYRIVGLTE